jgi:hypothetical protein
MTTQWNNNYNETMPFSDTCLSLNLVANTPQSWTIPGTSTQQFQALFEYPSNASVFVNKNGTAILPAGGSQSTVQYNEFKPMKRYAKGGDILSFITSDSAGVYMGVSLRQIQS